MTKRAQIWRKIGSRSAFGVLVAAMALWFGLGSARAASLRVIHAKSHAMSKAKPTTTRNARLRNASYKTKTTVRKRRRRRRHHITLPKAPSAERTEQIQSALARGGYYSGDPTGKWDSKTQESLQRFQSANGLPPTGKLDALSLQKMGLGSDVAGVSAPRTVMQGDSTGTSSSSTVPKTPGQ